MDNTKKIIAAGAALIAGGAAFAKLSATEATQDFLEASPYWDQSNVPVNVYKNKAPFTGKVVSTKRIVGPQATGETCHIIIDHKGDFPVRFMNSGWNYFDRAFRFSKQLNLSFVQLLSCLLHAPCQLHVAISINCR